ncbi:MAG: Smr/MutS family protein [Rhodospirillales bacterium]
MAGKPADGDRPKPPPKPPPKPLLGDAMLWRRVAAQVTPLKRRAPKSAPKPTPVVPPLPPMGPREKSPPRPATAPRSPPAPALRPGAAPGLDKSTHDKLRRGQLPIEGRLDLHGLDRERAHAALGRFLHNAAAQQRRCVLVVTGKGGTKPGEDSSGQGTGVLKSEVPRWLNEAALRPLILAFASAQARHGGGGALYVYLKRRRD